MATLVALFGGQAHAYLPDLQAAHASDSALARAIVTQGLAALAEEEAHEEASFHALRFPFASNWPLDVSKEPPPPAHLASAAVSYPLIFLSQMATYAWALDKQGVTQANHAYCAGASLSQGVVAALITSVSADNDALVRNTVLFARYMFWHGLRCHTNDLRMDGATVLSSPMLSVVGLPPAALAKVVDKANAELRSKSAATAKAGPASVAAQAELESSSDPLHLALINGPASCVVSGRPAALQALQAVLEKLGPAGGASQARVAFSKRRPEVSSSFLPTASPFHCELNRGAYERIMLDVARLGVDVALAAQPMRFPVPSTFSGEPLSDGPELMSSVVLMQTCQLADFSKTRVPAHATHVLDFGPGGRDGLGGAGKMLAKTLEGTGVAVVLCRVKPPQSLPSNTAALQAGAPLPAARARDWKTQFGPRLVRRASDGRVLVDTLWTRLTGKPPIIMPGMTPTTSFYGIDLVAACNAAGFHGELAAGGLPLPEYFTAKVRELVAKQPAGTGIAVNMLYLNAYLWGFQFPLVCELAQQGVPIETITIAAGVPTPAVAEDILAKLVGAGISYISLKPGTAEAIRDVLAIAQVARPMGVSVVVQWTGGRGGGHHSFEDFHQPLLDTYAEIRRHSNVVLVVGSGFGDWQGSLPYLTGDWALAFGRPCMPCDGVLFGSRCMVAKEAATSVEVKRLIAQSPGVASERDWEQSYDGDAGGVVTVTSELGEPIHKVHNRGMDCWREFDRRYFSLPRGPKRDEAVLRDKAFIVQRLNDDFQKVYFPHAHGDLADMSYAQVLRRMVELMYVRGGRADPRLASDRWIDVTYQSRTFLMLVRAERRFRRAAAPAVAVDATLMDAPSPERLLDAFEAAYPAAATTLMTDEDVAFFLDLCKDLRYGKPVNFVPVVDGDLDYWFKKDSLWCSEDIDAVPGRDAGRVCILQGPVAVRYSTAVDEPIADILGGIHAGWVAALAPHCPAATRELCMRLPEGNVADGSVPEWLAVALRSKLVVSGRRLVANPLPRLFVAGVLRVDSPTRAHSDAAELVFEPAVGSGPPHVVLRVKDRGVALDMAFRYEPALARAPLVESPDVAAAVSRFYRQVWSLDDADKNKAVKVVLADVLALNAAIGRTDEFTLQPSASASLDIATVLGWRPLIETLFAPELDGCNLLRLVHLSHGYTLLDDAHVPAPGDVVASSCACTAIEITPAGKRVSCTAQLRRNGSAWCEIHSAFLIRGEFTDYARTFNRHIPAHERRIAVHIANEPEAAVLAAKPWFKAARPVPGSTVEFALDSLDEVPAGPGGELASVSVRGRVLVAGAETGTIEYSAMNAKDNAVLAYLRRARLPHEAAKTFEHAGSILLDAPVLARAPMESESYAAASRDWNPIHRSTAFASLAGLPGDAPIVHGMWTLALARGVVEKHAAEGDAARVRRFQADMVDMVHGGDELAIQLTHTGVVGGRKVVQVAVVKAATGALVLKARAEVEQPRTAYLFTGQGSASVGMGMDRYAEVPAVKAVWDVADVHLRSRYGFSILDIVRHNPKELTVHFGGPAGRKLRDNYRAIRSSPGVQLLPEIGSDTKSFTFKAAEGLLFATQFAQPALVIIQKAAFSELVDGGLVPEDSIFAGHSLGEYAALASYASVLSVPDLVETVFLRGMVMQNAVERDERGRSAFAMVAANPSRVGAGFTADHLFTLVDALGEQCGELLQVVNYNIRDSQYVVAGHVVALDALGDVLSRMAAAQPSKAATAPSVEVRAAAVERARERFKASQQSGEAFELARGAATVPLPGIDVPFHSRQLLQGVPAFRELLEPRLRLDNVHAVAPKLVGRYIPNVTARPFTLDRDCIAHAAQVTGSRRLRELADAVARTDPAAVARTMLVELLAHQFAMPVRWIETQDVVFKAGTRRIIEMGPAPTLVTMAQRTFATGIYGTQPPAILWWGRDLAQIMYSEPVDAGPALDVFLAQLKQAREQKAAEDAPVAAAAAAAAASAPAAPTPAPPTPVPPPPPPSSLQQQQQQRRADGGDSAPTAKHVLRMLVASKLKKPLAEVKDDATIKALAGGKSAVQNEIVGDLAGEFGPGDAAAAEIPLGELAAKLQATGYVKLGKVASGVVAKTLASRLPGGLPASTARAHLAAKGLGPQRVESALLHACAVGAPAARLASEDEARRWLDEQADAFCRDQGIELAAVAKAPRAQGNDDDDDGDDDGGGSAAVPDQAPSTKHVLQVLLASKLKKPLADIKDDATLKTLTAGKSAVQNEIVGDLASEFGASDVSGDVSVGELAGRLKLAAGGKLGKVSSALVAKTLAGKLPGSFPASAARAHLQRGFGPMMTESVLLHACGLLPPAARLESDAAAQRWLDDAADAFCKDLGISRASAARSKRRGGGGGNGGRVVSSAALQQHEVKLAELFKAHGAALDSFLNVDAHAPLRKLDAERAALQASEAALDGVRRELGDALVDGVRAVFDARRQREYDSFWNWVVQDAMELHYHVLASLRQARGEAGVVVPNAEHPHFKAMAQWIKDVSLGKSGTPPQAWFRNFLCNRATPELLVAVEFMAASVLKSGQPEYAQIISLLAEQVEQWVDRPPVSVVRATHDRPCAVVGADGVLAYEERPREGVDSAEDYVESLSCGAAYDRLEDESLQVPHPAQSVTLEGLDAPFIEQDDDEASAAESPGSRPSPQRSASKPSRRPKARPQGPLLDAIRETVVRHHGDEKVNFVVLSERVPLCHLKSPSAVDRTIRVYDEERTADYLSCLHDAATRGVSFAGQVALVTGAGPGSIAVEVVKALLEGGATVVCTVNAAGRDDEGVQRAYKDYRALFEEHGAKGSRLVVLPFNAASAGDVAALVRHVYGELALDLDFVVPFAAIPERGKDIGAVDAQSELAHRAMLTNVVRLLGAIRDAKKSRGVVTRPAMVLVPCSPNHGVFGHDGLYAESKLGVEALVNKWRSEAWQDYLSLAMCVIGWTRSSLMWQNNLVASGVEARGCRTFSTSEMGVNLVGLMHPRMVTLAADAPLWADLTGGWTKVDDIDKATAVIREELALKAEVARALHRDGQLAPSPQQQQQQQSSKEPPVAQWVKRAGMPAASVPLAHPDLLRTAFPALPSATRLEALRPRLQGMVDLERVVVVVGYGEVGPWGSARTRWEMEAYGELSLEGCVELAWMVGLIAPHNGPLKSNPRQRHIGWVDAQTGEPVLDHDVKRRYEKQMLKHAGVRLLEPALFDGYDAADKRVWSRLAVDKDLPPIELSSREAGEGMRRALGGPDKVDVWVDDGGVWRARVKAGAVVAVPRAMRFDRFVVGQVPTGWSGERLGVPKEIAQAVDPVTLYALVSTMDAFCAAGVCDPYELYQYVHVSQVGNTSGGGMGGMRSLKRMFSDRVLDDPDVPSDTLAESFINTMPAWVNMLLISSAGPIKTPVGACATAAESVDIACETILSGKARVVVAGGFDDFGEVGSYEFAQMGATNNNAKDAERGRRPDEATRPMTSTRDGFVESHGAGMQVLMDAALAIEMGVPVYAVLAMANTATDKAGRSVPAPGRGILTTARRAAGAPAEHALLSTAARRPHLEAELARAPDYSASLPADVARRVEAKRRAAAYETWGQAFYRGVPEIAPLTGALAVWDLTADDVGVVSCHGTSTVLNDKNESAVCQMQLEKLGRTPGNLVLVVAQKWLTAHPKGAAAAWMLNGLVQVLNTGVVPGNRNLDNASEELRANSLLFYPNRSLLLPRVEAGLLKSFGFGQAGAEVLVVHPDRLLAALPAAQYDAYVQRRAERERRQFRYAQGVASGRHRLVQVKSRPPFADDAESFVYLNASARAQFDPQARTWMFKAPAANGAKHDHASSSAVAATAAFDGPSSSSSSSLAQGAEHTVRAPVAPASARLEATMREQSEGLARTSRGLGVGVDVEPVATLQARGDGFVERNFTASEIAYCRAAADPAASFAGRWAAKEAVVKALSNSAPDSRPLWEGAGAPLVDIEVLASPSGSPVVVLHGHAKEIARALGVGEVKVSISHAGDVAVAQALALA